MEHRIIEGIGVDVKTGTIEYVGTSTTSMGGEGFSILTFEGGEKIRNVIVDSSLSSYFDVGLSGTFYFVRADKAHVLVALEHATKTLVADSITLDAMAAEAKRPAKTFIGLGIFLTITAFGALIGIPLLIYSFFYSRSQVKPFVDSATLARKLEQKPLTLRREPQAPDHHVLESGAAQTPA